jgi:Zn finger protein HypA/HybF involved in hydrogenase expression
MTIIVNLRCMMCGNEYSEKTEEGDDHERTCPKCRSNSVRVLKSPSKDQEQ